MTRDGKDAFLAPTKAPSAPVEDAPLPNKERGCHEWGRRMFVDGVEVDPDTMKPLSELEE